MHKPTEVPSGPFQSFHDVRAVRSDSRVDTVRPPRTQFCWDRYVAITDLNGYVLAFDRGAEASP